MKTKSFNHYNSESSFHIVFFPRYRHDIFGKEQIKAFCEKTFNEISLKEHFLIRAAILLHQHMRASHRKFGQKIYHESGY